MARLPQLHPRIRWDLHPANLFKAFTPCRTSSVSLRTVVGARPTLGRQLAALPGYHVVDEDGGMRVWPGWDAVLPQCVAAGVHTIVVTCHPSMWGTVSLRQELGYSMHTCFLTGRADTYNRLGGMDFPFVRNCTVLLHCAPSSSSDYPTWTVTRGDVPWLAGVPQAPSAQVA
jgi:hypothetical protein